MKFSRFIVLMAASLSGLFIGCEETIPDDPEVDRPAVVIYLPEIEYTAKQQNVSVYADGAWTLSIDYKGESGGWATISVSSGTGEMEGILLSCEANGGDSARSLDLVLETAEGTVSCTLVQKSHYSEVTPTPGPDPDDRTPANVSGWMELPEIAEADKSAFYNHMMTVNGKSVRNYSFFWDARAMASLWVAYPLNTWLIDGYHSREDAFCLDPLLPRNKQPYLDEGGWGMWGYDRGHQIPQADRINISSPTRAANVATYYSTNMTCQNSDLNQNMWQELEGAVRGWASKVDTLYVVTGCVMDEMGRDFARDNDGKSVRIPDGYFKALLAYAGASEKNRIRWKDQLSETQYYVGIAFYFDNRSYHEARDYMSYAMTVSELEKMTGYNFFPRLSEVVDDGISSTIENNINAWWRKL